MTLGMLGAQALRDHRFFVRVARGDNFTIKTFDRAVQWFSDNWPDGAEWPADVPRPASCEPERAS